MKTKGLEIKNSDCEKLLELKFDHKLSDLCKKSNCETNALAIAKRCMNASDALFPYTTETFRYLKQMFTNRKSMSTTITNDIFNVKRVPSFNLSIMII